MSNAAQSFTSHHDVVLPFLSTMHTSTQTVALQYKLFHRIPVRGSSSLGVSSVSVVKTSIPFISRNTTEHGM